MKPAQTSRNANQITPAIRGFAFFNALKISDSPNRATNFNALKIWFRNESRRECLCSPPNEKAPHGAF
jgi:hypothetical protein